VVIDEHVANRFAAFDITGIAHEDIQPAVVVDIDHNHASAPGVGVGYAGFICNVFEFEIAFVKIEFITTHIGREVNIGQSVVVDIADGTAGAVVKISVTENIELGGILRFVGEVDTRVFHQTKPGVFVFRVCTGSKQGNRAKNSKKPIHTGLKLKKETVFSKRQSLFI